MTLRGNLGPWTLGHGILNILINNRQEGVRGIWEKQTSSQEVGGEVEGKPTSLIYQEIYLSYILKTNQIDLKDEFSNEEKTALNIKTNKDLPKRRRLPTLFSQCFQF